MGKATKPYSIRVCPVCDDWQLQGADMLLKAEIEQIILEHLYECFGVPVELRAA